MNSLLLWINIFKINKYMSKNCLKFKIVIVIKSKILFELFYELSR